MLFGFHEFGEWIWTIVRRIRHTLVCIIWRITIITHHIFSHISHNFLINFHFLSTPIQSNVYHQLNEFEFIFCLNCIILSADDNVKVNHDHHTHHIWLHKRRTYMKKLSSNLISLHIISNFGVSICPSLLIISISCSSSDTQITRHSTLKGATVELSTRQNFFKTLSLSLVSDAKRNIFSTLLVTWKNSRTNWDLSTICFYYAEWRRLCPSCHESLYGFLEMIRRKKCFEIQTLLF